MVKKIDGFILGIIAMLIISAFVPANFVNLTHNKIGWIANVGISLIFFFYGLKMDKHEVLKGIKNYKLHILVHFSTFVLFPCLAFLMKPLFAQFGINQFWAGFLFLAALPSTVSSSVVMVSMARGNVPAAIFNASISGMIGVVVTPLWMSAQSIGGDFIPTLLSLSLKILVPVIIGMLLNRYWGKWAMHHKKQLALFDKLVILLIVYNSFSLAFSSGLFASFSLLNILIMAGLTLSLLVISYILIWFASIRLGFSKEDQITACFCGSKKSLVHGSVMVQSMFKGDASQAIILLPVMIYHSLQLIIISFIAQRLAKRKD